MSKPRREEHVVIGPKGRIQCLHCGDSYDPYAGAPGRLVRIELMVSMGKAFEKAHRHCKKPDKPRCGACLELGHTLFEHVALKVKTAEAWLDCGDDGTSSKLIWEQMTRGSGFRALSHDNHPHDPDDFGRCFRLLAAPWAEGWRARMYEMAKYSGPWARLAGAWPELEALWIEESRPPSRAAPKLYARMKQLIGGTTG